MSVLRQFNSQPQLRIDAPHLRSIESSIAADFDVAVGRILAGNKALVVRGFSLSGSVGAPAVDLSMVTADSIAVNLNATEAGSFLWIPASRANEVLNGATNGRVLGSFAQGVNYIGIDFVRSPDASTTDVVKFLDADTLTTETPRSIPLGLTLDYRIIVTTVPFAANANLVPIAKITVNSNGNATAIVDARPMAYRLASGGDFPNQQSSYIWPFARQENSTSALFTGGDKNIYSEKDWQDAVMSRLWEIGGGANWYSPTADRNVRMVRTPGSVFTNGESFAVVSDNLRWQGLSIVFDNANTPGVYYNAINDQLVDSSGLTDLDPGDCIYVDLDRTSNATLTAVRAPMQSLGTPAVPGSRFVIAWRTSDAGNFTVWARDSGFPVGTTSPPATTSSLGIVQLNDTPGSLGTPQVVTVKASGHAAISGDWSYQSAKTYTTYIPLSELVPSDSTNIRFGYDVDVPNVGNPPAWANYDTLASAVDFNCSLQNSIPNGATITGMRVSLGTDTGPKNFEVRLTKSAVDANGFGAVTSILTTNPTVVAVATGYTWYNIPVTSTSFTSAGQTLLRVRMPTMGAGENGSILGIEITYTVTVNKMSF